MIKRIDTPFDDFPPPPGDEQYFQDDKDNFVDEVEFLPDDCFEDYQPIEEVRSDIIAQCREFFSILRRKKHR